MEIQRPNKEEQKLIPEILELVRFDADNDEQQYKFDNEQDFAGLQAEGVAMILKRLEEHKIALLADEVGMGKTFQALAVVAKQFKDKSDSNVLIITPRKEVLNQWKEQEYKEFYDKHLLDKVLPEYKNNKKDKIKSKDYEIIELPNFSEGLGLEGNTNAKIVFAKSTSFSTDRNFENNDDARLNEQLIKDINEFDLIVVDEAHKFRNYDDENENSTDSLIIKTAKQLFLNIKPEAKVLLMTATPLHSRAGDTRRIVDLFKKDLGKTDIEIMDKIMVRRLRVMSNGQNKYSYRKEIEKAIQLTGENSFDYKNELFFAMLQKKYAQNSDEKDLTRSKHLLDFLEGTNYDESYINSEENNDTINNDEILKDIIKKYDSAYESKPTNQKYKNVLDDILPKDERISHEKSLVFVRRTASAYELARQYIEDFDKKAWKLIDDAFDKTKSIGIPKDRDEFENLVKKYINDDFEGIINRNINEFKEEEIKNLHDRLKEKGYHVHREEYKSSLKKAIIDYYKFLKEDEEFDREKFKKFLKQNEVSQQDSMIAKEYETPKSKILEFFKRQKDPKDQNKKKYLSSTHAERFLNKFKSSNKTTYARFFEEDFVHILRNTITEKWIDEYTEKMYPLIKSAILYASIGLVELYCCDIEAFRKSNEVSTSQYEVFKNIVKNKIEKDDFDFIDEIKDFLNEFQKFEKYLNKADEESSKEESDTDKEIIKLKLDSSIFDGAQPAFPYVGSTKNKTVIARFNSPFFPKLLVGTSTLQEGVNLHLFCNKVYHFGSAHTMGDDEQRVGRVDRLMGKMDRELKSFKENENSVVQPTLDIHYPYLEKTFDEYNLKRMLCSKRNTEKQIDTGKSLVQYDQDIESSLTCDNSISELTYKPNLNV